MFLGMTINLYILYMLKQKYSDLVIFLHLKDKNHNYLYFKDFNRLLKNTVKHVITKKMKKIIRMWNVVIIVIKNMKMMVILPY